MDCNLLPITDRCVSNDRQTSGRENLGFPYGIVLVDLRMPLNQYLLTLETGVPRDYPLSYPKSVHFVVTTSGTVFRLVDTSNTAWGIDQYRGTNVPGIPVTIDPSTPWIFIGVENLQGGQCLPSIAQIESLSKIICCSCREYGISVSEDRILVEFDLDSSRSTLPEIPGTLLGLVSSCIATTGGNPVLTQTDLQEKLDALQTCCDSLNSQLVTILSNQSAMYSQLGSLSSTLPSLIQRISDLEQSWSSWFPFVEGIPQQIQSIMSLYQELKKCTDVVCPPLHTILQSEIRYVLQPGQTQTLTPNIPVWVNFPVKVSDTNPISVLPGPLWSATLSTECNHQISVTVRLDSSNWCAGKKCRLSLIACGNTIILDEKTMTGGGASVTLHGDTVITVPPTCTNVHVLVWTDDISTPNKVISSGDILIKC